MLKQIYETPTMQIVIYLYNNVLRNDLLFDGVVMTYIALKCICLSLKIRKKQVYFYILIFVCLFSKYEVHLNQMISNNIILKQKSMRIYRYNYIQSFHFLFYIHFHSVKKKFLNARIFLD